MSAPSRKWVGVEHSDGSWGGQLAGTQRETWMDHYDAHPDQGGKPTPNRALLHAQEIIEPAFHGRKTAHQLGETPIAILTMGGPASGKGVIVSTLKATSIDLSRFVHIDPDEVKTKLPEYQASVPIHASTGPTFRGAAAQVHEESSAVAKQIRRRAIDGGYHVLIDGTGGNAQSFISLIKDLIAHGYEVEVHHADLDVETAIVRASGRADRIGRYVPEHFIRETYAKIAAASHAIYAAAPTVYLYDMTARSRPKRIK